jgi:amidophosphoribosyltransferase
MSRDKFHDECGVFGILDHEDAANIVYLGLYALQHRGQESAGIASISLDGIASGSNIGPVGGRDGTGEQIPDSGRPQIHLERDMGYVADVFSHDRIERLPGEAAIGHVRYSTAGGSLLCNAQPLVASTSKGPLAVAHNGNLINGTKLREDLEQRGSIFNSMSDSEVVVHLVARSDADGVEAAFVDAMQRIEGAYSIVALAPNRIFVSRDPLGFRPLIIGVLGNSLCVASETCAFDLIGAKTLREVLPGETIVLDRADGRAPEERVRRIDYRPAERESRCIFEHVYFARPDSTIFTRNVGEVRKRFGAQLAREHPIDGDMVVPVPDSGVFAALGYAQESGIPFEYGLVRNHYVGRTFIEPKQSIRHFGVKVKLNPVRELVEGKRVILIDDSIVRGTTSKKIVRMLQEAGAREVHMRVSSPPTIGPCYYGIDTPRRRELIAGAQTIEEIRAFIEADSLGYLSVEGMLDAVRNRGDNPERLYCTACFTGRYPTMVPNQEGVLEEAATV